MFDFGLIENNSIIVCPNNKKDYLIKNRPPYLNVKFLSKEEVLSSLGFSYGEEAIIYLHDKYQYSYEVSKEILSNLNFIKKYNDKLNKLYDYYEELKKQNLLKFNYLFKDLLINKKIYIFGYSKLDTELISLLNNPTFIEEKQNNYLPTVYKYKDINTEVKNAFIYIMSLVEKGVELNNIYLYSYNSDYSLLIKKCINDYGLFLEGEEDNYLFDTPIFKNYLLLLNDYSYIEAFEKLQELNLTDNYKAIDKLIDIISKIGYLDLEKEQFIEYLSFLAKNKKINHVKYTNALKICDYNSEITDNDYAIMLGFSLDSYPKIYKDIDFFNDEEKIFLNKNTSKIKTQIAEEKLINFILNTKNLYISYKEKKGKNVYYPSLIINKLSLNVVDGPVSLIRYSKNALENEIAILYDQKRLFGIDNGYLETFDEEEIRYMEYDHLFKKIPNYYNNEKITLSYTQINEYNKCPFQYFVKRVLKANIFENSFESNLGSLYHKILEDSLRKTIDLSSYEEDIKTMFLTNKERFFVSFLLPQVLDVIKKNNEFLHNSSFNFPLAEQEIWLKIDEQTILNGRIDKIILNKDRTALIVIDYKTSDYKFHMDRNEYGVDLQLPIYSLLLDSKYPNYENVGMYIQNVCLSSDKLLKEENPYKLNGITIDKSNEVLSLDYELIENKKSKYIQKIRVNKDGDGVGDVSSSEYLKLKEVALEQIKKTILNIRKGDFDIAPIRFNNEMLPCKYCECNDICFKKYDDVRQIDLKKEEQ